MKINWKHDNPVRQGVYNQVWLGEKRFGSVGFGSARKSDKQEIMEEW